MKIEGTEKEIVDFMKRLLRPTVYVTEDSNATTHIDSLRDALCTIKPEPIIPDKKTEAKYQYDQIVSYPKIYYDWPLVYRVIRAYVRTMYDHLEKTNLWAAYDNAMRKPKGFTSDELKIQSRENDINDFYERLEKDVRTIRCIFGYGGVADNAPSDDPFTVSNESGPDYIIGSTVRFKTFESEYVLFLTISVTNYEISSVVARCSDAKRSIVPIDRNMLNIIKMGFNAASGKRSVATQSG